MRGAIPPLPNTLSWCGVQLKYRNKHLVIGDDFLWSCMKKKPYRGKPSSLIELRVMIMHLCLKVITHVGAHPEQIIRQNREHSDHVLY
jgi:hypothetical protein